MKKALVSILLLLNIFFVLCLLISYSALYISPDKLWMPALFGLAYPYLLGVNLLFVVVWLLFKPRYMLISAVAILAGWGVVARHIQFTPKITKGEGIKVITYNVRHFTGQKEGDQKLNADEIVKFLQEQDADIICLQEVRLRKNSIFNLPSTIKELSTINHYQYARTSTTFGSVTMTRFPVVDMGEIRFSDSRNMAIYTDVVMENDTVRILNVHLQSYQIDPRDYDILETPKLTEEKDLNELKEMSLKFREAVQLRAAQVREIRKYIDNTPYNIILCGDFNDTPASYAYQTLRSGLNDAFISSGKGFGRTYVGSLPAIRIDNIFYSDGFTASDFTTSDFSLSDHLPVSCRLRLE